MKENQPEQNTESRDITRDYYDSLRVTRTNLFEQAQTAQTREEFVDAFKRIIAINRIQTGLIPQMYPEVYSKIYRREEQQHE